MACISQALTLDDRSALGLHLRLHRCKVRLNGSLCVWRRLGPPLHPERLWLHPSLLFAQPYESSSLFLHYRFLRWLRETYSWLCFHGCLWSACSMLERVSWSSFFLQTWKSLLSKRVGTRDTSQSTETYSNNLLAGERSRGCARMKAPS